MEKKNDAIAQQVCCFLSLGSNMGSREWNLSEALRLLDGKETRIVECSSLYETEPVDVTKQPDFLNLVCRLETELDPYALLKKCQRIEQQLGRTRSSKRGPRLIDIDILYFRNEIFETEQLQIPHPRLAKRRFVLVPLHELAPGFEDPREKRTIDDLLHRCTDTSRVIYFADPPKREYSAGE